MPSNPLTPEQEARARGWAGTALIPDSPEAQDFKVFLAAALATVDELRGAVNVERESGAGITELWAQAARERDALRAEVARLREDTARLDAMADDLPFDGINGVDLHEWVGDRLQNSDDEAEAKGLYRAALRAALDAARERTP